MGPALRVQEIEFLEQGWMGRAMGETQLLNPLADLLPGQGSNLSPVQVWARCLGEKDPLRQAEAFQRLGAGTTIVTMGAQGAVLVQKDLRLRAGVYPVPFVDPSGGGDAFDAGYICGLLQGSGPEDCLRLASALGASCVRAIGTTPGVFNRSECEEFVRKNTLRINRI